MSEQAAAAANGAPAAAAVATVDPVVAAESGVPLVPLSGDGSPSSPPAADSAAASSNGASAGAADEDDDSDRPTKRVFTAEELVARAAAQREEDALLAAEASALREEQKALAAQIVKRRVAFGSGAGANSSQAVVPASDASDYERHDGRRKLSVLFVASSAACGLTAPLAAAWVRRLHAHVLTARVASSDEGKVEPHALWARLLEEQGLVPTGSAAAASSSSSTAEAAPAVMPLSRALRLPGASLPSCIVSLDEESKGACDAAVAETRCARIHQPFGASDASISWEQAEEMGARIKEFVTDLPELLAMM